VREDSLGRAWNLYLETLSPQKARAWGVVLKNTPGRKVGFWYWEMLGVMAGFQGGPDHASAP
jgi:hypothetical protein